MTGSKTEDAELLSRFTTTAEVFPFQQFIQSEWNVKNAGGAYKSSSQTFKHNPIFTLTVEEDDTNVCLMLRQHSSGKKTRESKGTSRGINWHKIGIYFFESSAQFHKLKQSDKICASTFINLPEVCVFLPGTKRLRAGTYLVICATYEPKLLAKFSFTALSDKKCCLEVGRTESAQPPKAEAGASAGRTMKKGMAKKTKRKSKARGKKKKAAATGISFQRAQQTQVRMSDLYANL